MATSENSCMFCSQENSCNSCINISGCASCGFLQYEIERITTELKSAWEIIWVLQENVKQNVDATTPRPKMAETWTEVRKGCRKNIVRKNQNNLVIISTNNRFSPLENHEEKEEIKLLADRQHIGRTKKKSRVVIIGDSHARGCATNIKKNLMESCHITGYVKPGAQTDRIINSAKSDIDALTKNDVVVVLGGTNDVGTNNSKRGIRNLVGFVRECQHTNVIVMSAPHRHDLVNWSCVNTEVGKFNATLKRRIKTFENTRVLDMDSERTYYTRHGLHLNNFGKKILARKISEEIRKIINLQRKEPIVLHWRDDAAKLKKEQDSGSDIGVIRRSERTRKPPQKLSNDFL